jgi:hypothetical protein
MSEEMKKAIELDQNTLKPAGPRKDDLSEKELEKVAGGWNGGVGDAFNQG